MDGNEEGNDRISELRQSGEAIGRLAEDPEIFKETVAAFRREDADAFQAAVAKAGLLDRCHHVCRWLCSKHCVFICRRLAGPLAGEETHDIDVEEWREFAKFTARVAGDADLLAEFVAIVDTVDSDRWRQAIEKHGASRFQHQLCHWLCMVRCRWVCRKMCPPPPLLIKVGYIPVGQINSQGYAAGDSSPGTFTPPDNVVAGVGHHPFGGTIHVNGTFNHPGAVEYKVEWALAPAGPWVGNAIMTAIEDATLAELLVGASHFRSPTGDWYAIADMDLLSEGQTYLTDWTPPAAAVSDLYYLRLTVRNAALVEFSSSPPVPVRVDNTGPEGPVMPGNRPRIDFSQHGKPLGCCDVVKQANGPITIEIEATDANFSRLDVVLYGGCSVSKTIYSKTYNGNVADLGAPAPGITVNWDPWKDGIEACCYVVFVNIWDRAIVNNSWSGGHLYQNWKSVTVA